MENRINKVNNSFIAKRNTLNPNCPDYVSHIENVVKTDMENRGNELTDYINLSYRLRYGKNLF